MLDRCGVENAAGGRSGRRSICIVAAMAGAPERPARSMERENILRDTMTSILIPLAATPEVDGPSFASG